MVKTAAVLFGVVFLLVGILGFVPAVTKDQMLLGIFHVNAAHNCVHLLSGVVALFAGMTSRGRGPLVFPHLRPRLRLGRRDGILCRRRNAARFDQQQHGRYLAPCGYRGGVAASGLHASERGDGVRFRSRLSEFFQAIDRLDNVLFCRSRIDGAEAERGNAFEGG